MLLSCYCLYVLVRVLLLLRACSCILFSLCEHDVQYYILKIVLCTCTFPHVFYRVIYLWISLWILKRKIMQYYTCFTMVSTPKKSTFCCNTFFSRLSKHAPRGTPFWLRWVAGLCGTMFSPQRHAICIPPRRPLPLPPPLLWPSPAHHTPFCQFVRGSFVLFIVWLPFRPSLLECVFSCFS